MLKKLQIKEKENFSFNLIQYNNNSNNNSSNNNSSNNNNFLFYIKLYSHESANDLTVM